MTDILSILQSIPMGVGVVVAILLICAVYSPWRFIFELMLLAAVISAGIMIYPFYSLWRRFKRWMRKREPWYDDFDEWMAENARL